MTKEENRLFRRQMFIAALGAMMVICLPAWGSVYWMRTKDHFKIEQSVSQEDFFKLQLLMEAKNRYLETISLDNKNDIEHLEQALAELKKVNEEINKFLRDEFNTRGEPVSELFR